MLRSIIVLCAFSLVSSSFASCRVARNKRVCYIAAYLTRNHDAVAETVRLRRVGAPFRYQASFTTDRGMLCDLTVLAPMLNSGIDTNQQGLYHNDFDSQTYRSVPRFIDRLQFINKSCYYADVLAEEGVDDLVRRLANQLQSQDNH